MLSKKLSLWGPGLGVKGFMIQIVVANQKPGNRLVAGEVPGHCQGALKQGLKPQMLIRAAYSVTPLSE